MSQGFAIPPGTGGITAIKVSAGTLSSNRTDVTFADSNGVSWGLNTNGVVTATVGAAGGAGTGFTTATTAGTVIVGTLSTNGLSMGVPGYLTTAMQSNAATISNVNISAGTTSTNGSAFTFSNSNGVSFGLGTGANAGVVTGTVATNYAGQGFTTATTTGTAIVGTLSTNGLSMGVPAYLTTAMQSNAATISNVNISAGTTSTNASAFTFSNANGVSFGLGTGANAGVITGTVQTNYLTTAALSSQTLAFSLGGNSGTTNSSQILNGGYILAGGNNITINQSNNSVSIVGGAAGGIALSNSQTLFSSGTVNLLEGGGAITIASSAGGQSFKFSVPQTSSIVGTNGISVTTNGSTISVSLIGTTGSYWANMPFLDASTTTFAQSNSFYVFPISLPYNVSASYLRFLASFNFTSTTIATSAVNNATGASTAFSETQAFNAVLYTVGTGANSRSLGYLFSTSAGLTWAASVSQASTSNATNQSFTQRITYPSLGFTTATTSTQYSVSATNGPISTTQWSNLSAQKFLDIPWATSMSAGVYWMAINRISGTVGGKNMDMAATTYGNSQQNLTWGDLNAASNLSNAAPQFGLGLWTTNAAQTSSSIAFASVSATTSYMVPMVQFINQA